MGTKIYRAYYEGKTNLIEMWTGNPILTVVIFGLPLAFLSLIFYSICCADFMDAPEDEDGKASPIVSCMTLKFFLF
jgi:thioredoxin domain-containing protein 10